MAKETLQVEARLQDSISKNLDKIANKLDNFGTKTEKNTDKAKKNANSLSSAWKAGGAQMTKSLGLAAAAIAIVTKGLQLLKQALVSIIKVNRVFEKSLSTIKAILKPTSADMEALTERARDLGASTIFSASQAAEAFTEMGKLGLTANQILAASEGVLSLAAVAQIDLAQAASITAETLAQFSLPAGEANRVVDVMAKSFNISALSADRFKESMKFVGPVASGVGESLESATAALATLAQRGISGSQAGTGLRFTLSQLAQEGSKVGEILGITANDTRTLAEKLEQLKNMNLTTGQVMEIFGERAGVVANILINNTEQTAAFADELERASGTAKDMADIMTDNLDGAMKELNSNWEELSITLGTTLLPALTKIVDLTTFLVKTQTFALKFYSGTLNIEQERMKIFIKQNSSEEGRQRLLKQRVELMTRLRSIEAKASEASEKFLETRDKSSKKRMKTLNNEANRIIELVGMLNSALSQSDVVKAPPGSGDIASISSSTSDSGSKADKLTGLQSPVAAQQRAAELSKIQQENITRSIELMKNRFERERALQSAKQEEEINAFLYQSSLLMMTEEMTQDRLTLIKEKGANDRKLIDEREAAHNAYIRQTMLGGAEKFTSSMADLTDSVVNKETKAAKVLQVISAGIALVRGTLAGVTAVQKAWESSSSWQEGLAASLTVGAEVAALTASFVGTIKAAKFARGGDFVTNGPTGMIVGDNPGGRERVTVTPLSSKNMEGPNQTNALNVTNTITIPENSVIDRDAAELIVEAQRQQGLELENALRNGYLDNFVNDMKEHMNA